MEKRQRNYGGSSGYLSSENSQTQESIEVLVAFQRIAEQQTRTHVINYVRALANVESGKTPMGNSGKRAYS